MGRAAAIERLNDHVVDLACLPDRKMDVVRLLAELGDVVHDVDIDAPRLEEVYAHYTGPETAA